MSLNLTKTQLFCYGLLIVLLSSCYHPPFNNFRHDHRVARRTIIAGSVGAAGGALITGTVSGTLVGAAIGGSIGAITAYYKDSKPSLIKQLKKEDIEFIEYGDTMTLIIPTDKYFIFESPRLNELCYPGLMNIIRLLRLYPKSPIYVAAFTDNVGSRYHKRMLTQAQAETMMTFLWANGISAQRLKAEGYGDKNDVADNTLIHGSAQNRRIEIQWFTALVAQAPLSPTTYVK